MRARVNSSSSLDAAEQFPGLDEGNTDSSNSQLVELRTRCERDVEQPRGLERVTLDHEEGKLSRVCTSAREREFGRRDALHLCCKELIWKL